MLDSEVEDLKPLLKKSVDLYDKIKGLESQRLRLWIFFDAGRERKIDLRFFKLKKLMDIKFELGEDVSEALSLIE